MSAVVDNEHVQVDGEGQENKEADIVVGDGSDRLNSRFYRSVYPEVDEVVMVNVTKVADVGAYVTLLEYNDIEGMILRSEFSRRRIRSINKLIRVGRNEVVAVLRVDTEKGYIDLSKRRVSPEDVLKCEDRFNKAKAVHSVLRHVADLQGLRLDELYEKVGWPLQDKYGSTYDAFKLILGEGDEGTVFGGLDITESVKETLITHIRRRLAPQPVKIRAEVEVRCFTEEGIDAIKEALEAGEKAGTDDVRIKIQLIAPPKYSMTTTTLERELGLEVMQGAINAITEYITARGGQADVSDAPKVVTQRDENELQVAMERYRAENEQVDGDAPEDV